jgi:hypothetical protein
MMAETAFCTSCGAVVGKDWELCEACGAEQPVEVAAIGQAAEDEAETRPTAPAAAAISTTPVGGAGQRTAAATNLLVIGCLFLLAGVVYLLATAGFPPGITTTYEYHPDGSTSTSTSPDMVEGIVTVALFGIGAVLARASQVAKSSGR